MKSNLVISWLSILFISATLPSFAQGTAYTYQGRLNGIEGGVTGIYDFRFAVFDAGANGSQVGPTLNVSGVGVTNGLFTVALDFGANIFNGASRWLDLAAKTNGSTLPFVSMTPRQPLTPSPYAVYAANANAVTPGAIGNAQLTAGAVAQSNLVVSGTPGAGKVLGTSGSGLSWVDAPAAGGGWSLSGNAGTTPPTQFLGTTDNQPLEVKVNGQRAMRFEAGLYSDGGSVVTSPNLIGGYAQNYIAPGIAGSVIAGGGGYYEGGLAESGSNSVTANYSTIGGGTKNTIQSNSTYGVIGGGAANSINATSLAATIAGGTYNAVQNNTLYATIGGGVLNVIKTNAIGAVIAGGYINNVLVGANDAVISGGFSNTNGGQFATIPGGSHNAALGNMSLAAGQRAKAVHDGSFVWSDSQAADFSSSSVNQFLVRAQGGVGINKNNPATALDVAGTVTATGFSGNGGGLNNLPLGALTAGGLLTWPGNFAVGSSPSVGDGPHSVVAADVNGDGKVDLISANINASSLTVLTNNGSGGFVFSSSPTVDYMPASVVAADVNGDGKVDLISANYGASTLTVLTNNGAGAFGLASSLVAGFGTWSVAVTDVNGDGKIDLVSANYNANTLTVLTNNGSGGFVLAASLAVGNGSSSVAAADVNGDGKMDLISANQDANTLTVMTNNGNGGFVLASSPTVGSGPSAVVAADVNGDGKVDLISANYFSGTLTVLTNDGGGGFVLASTPGVGYGASSIAAADINGDGKVDLISANSSGSSLTVLTNNGSGGFATASSPGVGANPNCVVAADVNGDGRVDLISANGSDDTLSVLLNVMTLRGDLIGDGSGLTSVPATNLTGTISPMQLPGNIAYLNSNQLFTAAQTVSNSLTVGTAVGSLTLGNDSGLAVGISATGGGNAGHIRVRNALEVWPNAGGTVAGSINVRDTSGSGTILLDGASGTVATTLLRVNGGTTVTNFLAGQVLAGGSITSKTNVTVTFPKMFNSVPKIMATVIADPAWNVDDTFVASVRKVTTTNCVINILRVDSPSGWSQQLSVNWMAWE